MKHKGFTNKSVNRICIDCMDPVVVCVSVFFEQCTSYGPVKDSLASELGDSGHLCASSKAAESIHNLQ